MNLWSIFSVLLVSLVLIKLSSFWKTKKQLPPGPTPLPIIGSLHLLGKRPHKSLADLAQIYGPIMSLKLGRITCTVVSSSTAKEVLKTQDLTFSSRFIPESAHAENYHQNSIGWIPVGTKWRTLRKIMTTNVFSNKMLNSNQHLRAKKVKELIAYCETSCKAGKAVEISRASYQISLYIMSNAVFSKDLSDDPNLDSSKEFKELVESVMHESGKPNLADYFPMLKMIDPQGVRRRLTVSLRKLLQQFDVLINERVELRKKGQRSSGDNRDVLDICLDMNEENPKEMDMDTFKGLCLDFFMGGTDTTTITIEWAMAELIRHPEVMMKAKEELNQVIGKGKIVEESDISQLPYLQCIMKETLRLHPAGPFLVPRRIHSDAKVNGYIVPNGSMVIVNAWAIGRDPSLWEDPLNFKPERFLTLERDYGGQDFDYLPFGGGRRICPGMPLASRMITVITGSLINTFDWKLDGEMEPKDLDMDDKFGLLLHKENYLQVVPLKLAA